MKYKVEYSCDLAQFQRYVNEEIAKGWKPLGGIAVVEEADSQLTTYFQAMTLDEAGV